MSTDLLNAPMGPHSFDDIGRGHIPNSDKGTAYDYQGFNLGINGLLVGRIHGDERGAECPGYPSPTIEEAEAIRNEIIRRWNLCTNT